MPELGKYAGFVLSAYGISLLMLAVLIGATLWRGSRVRAALAAREAQTPQDDARQDGGGRDGGGRDGHA